MFLDALNKIFRGLATLLKSHFGIGALLYIYCIFSEHVRTPELLKNTSGGCFWTFKSSSKERVAAVLFSVLNA